MKKSNNLREIWPDLKFLSINKCLYFLARCLAVHPLRQKSELEDPYSAVLHIILSVRGGVMVHCVFPIQEIQVHLLLTTHGGRIGQVHCSTAGSWLSGPPIQRHWLMQLLLLRTVCQVTYLSLASPSLPFRWVATGRKKQMITRSIEYR